MSKVDDKIKKLRDKLRSGKAVKGLALLTMLSFSQETKSYPVQNSSKEKSSETTITVSPKQGNDMLNAEEMAKVLEEKGLNTISNFDVSEVQWARETIDSLQEGEISKKIKKNILAGKTANTNNRWCLKGVKAILRSAKAQMTKKFYNLGHAYQAVDELRQSPDFVEIKVKYGMLDCLPEGSIVVQDKGGRSRDGHIFCVKKNKNKKNVQECGQQGGDWNIPKNKGKYGDEVYAFVPADCKLPKEVVTALLKDGKFINPETLQDNNTAYYAMAAQKKSGRGA